MDQFPEFIVKPDLIALYEKLSLYIATNFPLCIITINSKSVSFGYADEFTRIFLYQDKEQTALILKITQDLTNKMSSENGLLYKIKSYDDIQYIKSGIKVIMECRVPKAAPVIPETPSANEPAKAEPSYSKKQASSSFKNMLSKLGKSNNS